MHDWTLLKIRIDWAESSTELTVLDEHSAIRSIFFRGLREFSADRQSIGVQAAQSMRPLGILRLLEEEFV